MAELFASIKAFIEKGNIIIFLLAIAASILTYQIISNEALWAAFVFCVSYAVFYGLHCLFENYKTNIQIEEDEKRKQESERIRKSQEDIQIQQQREQTEAHLKTIFNSFPEDVKNGLIKLYNLPQIDGGFLNSRIVYNANLNDYADILSACNQIRFTIGIGREELIDIKPSIDSQIITLLPEFYKIIEEIAIKEKE